MKQSTNKLNQAIERLTTGFKINHAKDNAANYNIATNITTKLGALQVAEDNCAMGLDMLATANGTLDQIHDKLQRLRDLAVQSSNGTYSSQSKLAINAEANALVDEIERLYSTAEYNGIKLFDGSTDTVSNTTLMQTYSLIRTTSVSNGFIKQIIQRDTALMTTFASVDENVDLVDGTYSISTSEELVKLEDMVYNGLISEGDEFVLANDIDMASISNFWGIGGVLGTGASLDQYFRGVFDGNGFKITNLEMLSSRGGLFGFVSGSIKNVEIRDVYLNGGAEQAGLVAVLDGGSVTNCAANNVYVQLGGSYVGGLVGSIRSGSLSYSYATNLSVNMNDDEVGGLVGYNAGTISNCFSSGSLDGVWGLGALVGKNEGDVCNSYSEVVITGTLSPTAVTNSDDWDGTTFSLYQPSSDAQNSNPDSDIDGDSIGGGGATENKPPFLPPSYAPDKILLQIGDISNWASQVGVNTKFSLLRIDDLRMIGLDLTTDYLTQIDDTLAIVGEKQTHFGTVQNRLTSVLDEISTQYENLLSSRSTLQDADIAEVSSEYIRQQILQQASATLLSTANQSPSIALQLI